MHITKDVLLEWRKLSDKAMLSAIDEYVPIEFEILLNYIDYLNDNIKSRQYILQYQYANETKWHDINGKGIDDLAEAKQRLYLDHERLSEPEWKFRIVLREVKDTVVE